MRSCKWVVTVACMLGASACANILDIPDEPELVMSGPWRCLQRSSDVKPPATDKAVVQIDACNFVSTNCSQPVTGLTAALCNKRDVNCSDPLQSEIADTGGILTVEVPTGGVLGEGFDGYMQILAPTANCTDESAFGSAGPVLCGIAPGCDVDAPDDNCMMPTFAPAMVFFNPAIRADVKQPIPVPLVPTTAVFSLIDATGVELDPTTGNVFVTARDCDGHPAKRVRYMMHTGGGSTVLYLRNGVVSDSATETDASGMGGFIGVPAGFAEIRGYVEGENGELIEIGEVGVQVAPFTITYATLTP